MNEYIKNSNKRSKKALGEIRYGPIQVVIKDHFIENNIDLDVVMKDVASKVPEQYLEYIDYIIIGQFKELEKRSVNAAYMDGAIYVTNRQDDEDDMIDDVVHEIAHAIEERHAEFIYSDRNIESEFLSKRERLFHLLEAEGYDINFQDFMEVEYSTSFDSLLYNEIGYPLLAAMSVNIFYSPYAITSLREYFANGFEAYYNVRDIERISKISPILFDKLDKLNYNKES